MYLLSAEEILKKVKRCCAWINWRVGMAAVQLGKYLGAKVIATGTSEEKLALTKEWGADHTVLTHKNGDVGLGKKSKT